MIDKAILKKIMKCLALAKSANEHEAAAALAKAQELMVLHGISDADLKLADIEMAAAKRNASAKPATWEVTLMDVVAGVFACEFYLEGREVRFVGAGPAPVIASYAFGAVFRLIKRHRADYVKRVLRRCRAGVRNSRADHFCLGWSRGVELSIVCLVPERRENALAKLWMEQNLTLRPAVTRAPSKTRSTAATDDYWNGIKIGSEVELHHGLTGRAAAPPERIGVA